MLLPVLNFLAFLSVIHQLEDLKVEFHWERVRIFDQLAAKIFHGICLENLVAKVEHVQSKSKPKSKWRPLPMDTVISLREWLFTQIFSKLFL